MIIETIYDINDEVFVVSANILQRGNVCGIITKAYHDGETVSEEIDYMVYLRASERNYECSFKKKEIYGSLEEYMKALKIKFGIKMESSVEEVFTYKKCSRKSCVIYSKIHPMNCKQKFLDQEGEPCYWFYDERDIEDSELCIYTHCVPNGNGNGKKNKCKFYAMRSPTCSYFPNEEGEK